MLADHDIRMLEEDVDALKKLFNDVIIISFPGG